MLPFLCVAGLNVSSVFAQNNSTITIPESRYYPYTNGYTNFEEDSFFTVPSFEATPLITLGEYKEFMRSFSGNDNYPDSLMPDSSICDPETYRKYLSRKKYDKYPALGISWQNALEYCIWRTKKDNPDTGLVFIYRLPYLMEWDLMVQHKESLTKNFEINQHYAEWMMASFDESAFQFSRNLNRAYPFEYIYYAKETDPQVLKRMQIHGRSFISNDKEKQYGYSFAGYRDVGFRMVKEYVNKPGQMPSPIFENKNLMQLYGIKQ